MTSGRRLSPSVVVSPLTPALITFWCSNFDKSSGQLCPGSTPKPAVKLSPKATITGAGAESSTPEAAASHPTISALLTQCHNKGSPVIRVSGLTKSISTATHRVDILKGIDFHVTRGEFVAIMGASGSGKSTLLGLLAGLDNPSEGSVALNGTVISDMPEDKLAQLRGRTIGFVFQSYQLIPTLTALENVLLPYELNDETGGRKAGLDRACQLLTSVGLDARMDHYPVQLSGGEQQRVALARAFILRPPIVLADEPTGNLDTVNGRHILDLLLQLNRAEGTTLVLVTHDPALAEHATRIITLRDGLVVSDEQQAPQAGA